MSYWLAELNYSLTNIKSCINETTSIDNLIEPSEDEDLCHLAKSYFDLKEYNRAAYFLEKCKTSKGKFLYFYSLYLAGEKKKIDDMTDIRPDSLKNSNLKYLCCELKKEYTHENLDGFGLYLYGIILKKLQLPKEATRILLESVHKQPMHWGTWLELSSLITDNEMLETLVLPNHWIKQFFMAHTYLKLQLLNECLEIYYTLQTFGFERNGYLLSQTAIAVHHKRDVDTAIATFQQIIEDDPYCLDNMDTYSNLLYVKELKNELAYLAHRTTEIDKYRVETCCIVGNYYSLRADHQKAIMYFQRALKLNPQYISAWTLLGHEFMEMKNTNGAIHSYRQAIEIDKRDYRAWYGLGQTYEILKMPFYGLYYYKQAHLLKPRDSRMILALGEAYEKQEKVPEALKCYHKACNVGDIEGMALIRLATLYEKLGQHNNAAAAYVDFVTDECKNSDRAELSHAYKFLTQYHLKLNELDDANHYAQKCLQYDETKEEAKAFLRTIAQKRIKGEDNLMMVEYINETNAINEDKRHILVNILLLQSGDQRQYSVPQCKHKREKYLHKLLVDKNLHLTWTVAD
ncbi:cell division cycle protein 23 homolog isoform X2 [Copidosoma floridanum]|uniref:cell division cycle protein 23 homolog isoform X2 n=1 Tax=Copidosoma floridanum TaxID=29053 RepID=UPI0006C9B314|nr:cell division cycle protein 23 homolog isoform X2 [Copidosoma floridanum]